MFIYTASGKKLMRMIIVVLAVLVGAGIIIMAVMSSFKVSAAEGKLPIYSVSRTDKKIAITFDCAWGNSNTDLLLKTLEEAGAKATFFVTGEFCDKYPEDVKKIFDAGHEIANHSDTHPHVVGMNINDLIEDTRECSRKIKMITGQEPVLYRAPYGEYDDTVITTIEGMGMKVIQWSVDSIDWEDPDADTIIDRILGGTASGSILLFHNDLENTAQALPEILASLTEQGYSFETVSDMVYYDSYHIDSSGMQIYDATAAAPTFTYSSDPVLEEIMEIFRQNLTMDEIYSLAGGVTTEILEKTRSLLTEEQIAVIYEASFEDLKEAVTNLIATAEAEGAGGNAQLSDEPEETSTTGMDYYEPETTTAAEEAAAETTAATTTPIAAK